MTRKTTNHDYSAKHSDISEETLRKQMEKALRESEERYRDLVENAMDLICTHDLKGTLLSVNKAVLDATGYSPEEITGLRLPDILSYNRRSEFDKYIKTILRDGTATGTMKIMTREGGVRYWEYRNTLRKNGVPEPVVRGIARDVTGEILARKALKSSEEKYRLLFERNLAGVYRTTTDGRILDCNDAFARIYGYDSRDEVRKRSAVDFHVNAEARRKIIERLETEGALIDFEVQGRRRDGSLIWLLENISLIPDKDGEHKVLEGTILDITERKRMEDALRKNEEKYRLIFEYSPIGLLFFDEKGVIKTCNDNFIRIVGSSREKLVGLNMLDLPDKKIIEAVQKALNGSTGTYEDTYHSITAEKSTPVRALFAPIDIGSGSIAGGVGIVEDITERRKLDEELLRADKLESVGLLAGGIAHDFNNVLTSVSGFVSLAKIHSKEGDRISHFLSSAETALKRAKGLTKQLLTFAKGGKPVKETASISNIIKETPLLVLKDSKSVCEFSISDDLWPVEADTGQIGQVIGNLVMNADQAMPDGGTVRVEAENLLLEDRNEMKLKPGRYIRIAVKDQGSGIDENHLSKIFDPFFTTKEKGSGLGLTAVYSIIKEHNGHISVESGLGKGAVFNIHLPASEGKIYPEKEEAGLLKAKGKLLVMDDDVLLKEMMKEMLEMLGYKADFAKDGKEALNMFKQARDTEKPYDVVMLDLTIPGGMGGKETVKRLLDVDRRLKAIVFSGYSDDPVMSNYREYGFKGMMPKPFDFESLGKTLHEVLKAESCES